MELEKIVAFLCYAINKQAHTASQNASLLSAKKPANFPEIIRFFTFFTGGKQTTVDVVMFKWSENYIFRTYLCDGIWSLDIIIGGVYAKHEP